MAASVTKTAVPMTITTPAQADSISSIALYQSGSQTFLFSSVGRFIGHAVAEVQVQSLHPVTKRMTGQFKLFRGACQVKTALLQSAGNQLSLQCARGRRRAIRRAPDASPGLSANALRLENPGGWTAGFRSSFPKSAPAQSRCAIHARSPASECESNFCRAGGVMP